MNFEETFNEFLEIYQLITIIKSFIFKQWRFLIVEKLKFLVKDDKFEFSFEIFANFVN